MAKQTGNEQTGNGGLVGFSPYRAGGGQRSGSGVRVAVRKMGKTIAKLLIFSGDIVERFELHRDKMLYLSRDDKNLYFDTAPRVEETAPFVIRGAKKRYLSAANVIDSLKLKPEIGYYSVTKTETGFSINYSGQV